MLLGKCGPTLEQGDLLMVETVCWVCVPIPNQSTREILDNSIRLIESEIEEGLHRAGRTSVTSETLGGKSGRGAIVLEEVL
jgi:hypothetical protein